MNLQLAKKIVIFGNNFHFLFRLPIIYMEKENVKS